ncbi:hypothetical protein ACC775_38435, partial [Rhizobium ruizarguesonis]
QELVIRRGRVEHGGAAEIFDEIEVEGRERDGAIGQRKMLGTDAEGDLLSLPAFQPKVKRAAEILQIEKLLERKPKALSGG